MTDLAFFLSLAIFLVAYGIIISEKVHRMVVAMAGGMAMVLCGFVTQETALVEDIDFNTLGLLIGMMILVAITRRTGAFEAVAVWAAQVTRGQPLRLLALLSLITAAASALLDNVTTVLLVVPVTLTLTDRLDLNPVPFLLSEIMASNIGGTATLIGDPPNIMIGSAVGLTFNDFLLVLAPVCVVILLVTVALLLFFYRRELNVSEENRRELLSLEAAAQIRDWRLLKKSLAVLALTIGSFMLHGVLGLESATLAMTGAMVLLWLSGEEPEEILLNIEWPTIFFFTGLFVLVGGLKGTGVIGALARWCLELTGGQLQPMTFLVLWVSAVASAFIDNIPFVATMIPLLKEVGQLGGLPMEAVWWALSLGACLGGNGTLVGASANVVVAGIAEKNGYLISFLYYLKIAFPLMLLSIVLSHLYLWLLYF